MISDLVQHGSLPEISAPRTRDASEPAAFLARRLPSRRRIGAGRVEDIVPDRFRGRARPPLAFAQGTGAFGPR
jgi:hypothetical protein